jgi:hypothetical protein
MVRSCLKTHCQPWSSIVKVCLHLRPFLYGAQLNWGDRNLAGADVGVVGEGVREYTSGKSGGVPWHNTRKRLYGYLPGRIEV